MACKSISGDVPCLGRGASETPCPEDSSTETLRGEEKILDICGTPCTFETVLKKLFDEYGLTMNNEQYVLVGSTVRSYLAWLKDTGRLTFAFENNTMLWSVN